ncbi:MAG: NUDIX hydrolase [Pseudomonadota bacterium]
MSARKFLFRRRPRHGITGPMRRIGETIQQGVNYKLRTGAYGIILAADGNMLLVDESGELQLPGGGIDPGESPLQALHREVIEETGWRIAEPCRLGAFQRWVFMPDYDLWAHKIQLIYTARAVRPLGPPTEGWHLPVFMPPAQAARSLDVEGDREMVRLAIRLGLV